MSIARTFFDSVPPIKLTSVVIPHLLCNGYIEVMGEATVVPDRDMAIKTTVFRADDTTVIISLEDFEKGVIQRKPSMPDRVVVKARATIRNDVKSMEDVKIALIFDVSNAEVPMEVTFGQLVAFGFLIFHPGFLSGNFNSFNCERIGIVKTHIIFEAATNDFITTVDFKIPDGVFNLVGRTIFEVASGINGEPLKIQAELRNHRPGGILLLDLI